MSRQDDDHQRYRALNELFGILFPGNPDVLRTALLELGADGRKAVGYIPFTGAATIINSKAALELVRRGLYRPQEFAVFLRMYRHQAADIQVAAKACGVKWDAVKALTGGHGASEPSRSPLVPTRVNDAAAQLPSAPAPHPPSSPADPRLADLHQALAAGRVLFIVGAGVSMGTTAQALSWGELLKNGLSECVAFGGQREGWRSAQETLLEEGDTDDWIQVAGAVTKKLGGSGHGTFKKWLKKTVGSWRARRPEVIKALAALSGRIATTNYDNLLTEVTGKAPVVWDDGFEVGEWLDDPSPGILHLHGHWRTSTSVVLGSRSYWRITEDTRAQAIQHALAMQYTLVFVGCGATTEDPNLGAMLDWMTEHLRESGRYHYRLCRASEVAGLEKIHPAASKIFPLVYGREHSDLLGWLRAQNEALGGAGSA